MTRKRQRALKVTLNFLWKKNKEEEKKKKEKESHKQNFQKRKNVVSGIFKNMDKFNS